jgi:protein ImuB
MLVVHVPNWPAVALGLSSGLAAVVIEAGRVVATNPAGRKLGIEDDMRHRDAQTIAPELETKERDLVQEVRLFEPIVKILEEISPVVEVLQLGTCITPTRGPSRYFKGDSQLVAHIRKALAAAGVKHVRIGIADGYFSALVAARDDVIVPAGSSADFLARKSIFTLDDRELCQLLNRLGISTLGRFAALDTHKVSARFGPTGHKALMQARGLDARQIQPRSHHNEWDSARSFNQPIINSEQVVFAVKEMANNLYNDLSLGGFTSSLLGIEFKTTDGTTQLRWWRHETAFDANAAATRARWQLETWSTPADNSTTDANVNAGIEQIRLLPNDLSTSQGTQFAFWDRRNEQRDAKASHAMVRVQTLLGFEEVSTARITGGRTHKSRVQYTQWLQEPLPSNNSSPWPGALPSPSPVLIPRNREEVQLLDEQDEPVVVTKRGWWKRPPASVRDGNARQKILQYSSPWPMDEYWWDDQSHQRCVHLQIVTETSRALLLAYSQNKWTIAGIY